MSPWWSPSETQQGAPRVHGSAQAPMASHARGKGAFPPAVTCPSPRHRANPSPPSAWAGVFPRAELRALGTAVRF